ncbi:MAG: hypothetical protein M1826_006660 [Phylliscum demangeonii]|nr:MAG: hypothetical protein M1826_006660 [Phylliscum demangeonii]
MGDTPKDVVEKGYDCIAHQYLEWSNPSDERMASFRQLLARLPEHAQTLDLGCGAGIPWTSTLAQHGQVTAVDISAAQIRLAEQHVPGARLIKADMMSLAFAPGSFDAIVAFHSIIHLPRDEQATLIQRLSDWLRPGGYAALNLAAADDSGSINPDWLGAPMYWSGHDTQTSRRWFDQAGLRLLDAKVVDQVEDGVVVSHFWVLATKEASAS